MLTDNLLRQFLLKAVLPEVLRRTVDTLTQTDQEASPLAVAKEAIVNFFVISDGSIDNPENFMLLWGCIMTDIPKLSPKPDP